MPRTGSCVIQSRRRRSSVLGDVHAVNRDASLRLAQAPSSRAAEMPGLPPARHWGNAALVNSPIDTTRCIDANRSVRNGRVGADGEGAHALDLDGDGGEAEPGQG